MPLWLPMMAWWIYRQAKAITLRDLRVWLACLEQREQRCPLRGRADTSMINHTVKELARLAGSTPKCVRQSLGRLEAVGLVAWSREAIAFPQSPDSIRVEDLAGFWAMMAKIEKSGRRLPIPRRMLRVLAGRARPALIATVLGHLVRCLHVDGRSKRPRFKTRGRCKVSWVADVFGMAMDTIKTARADLVERGWLTVLPSHQRTMNRRGARVEVNPSWDRLDDVATSPPAPGPKSPPPPPAPGPKSPPPLVDQEPLPMGERCKNQEPTATAADPSGDCIHLGGREKTLPKPTMRDVRAEDLRDTGRLLALLEDAIARGGVSTSEADRQWFVAAAEHARSVGDRNPPGLFAAIVRRPHLRKFLTHDDEDAARRRLRDHDVEAREREQSRPPDPMPREDRDTLSDEDRRRFELRRQLAAVGRQAAGDARP